MTQNHDGYQVLRDALDNIGSQIKPQYGDAYMAECPAHSDDDPSLSVDRGTVHSDLPVITCHGGCDTLDVLDALDLSWTDLYPPRDRETHVYPGGAEVTRQRKADGKKDIWQGGNKADRSLYHSDKLPESPEIPVLVVEGETDADTALYLDRAYAVSPRQGSNTDPSRYDWSPLKGRPVIIVADWDSHGGGLKHAHKVYRLLENVAGSVRIVRAAEGKDFRDHVQNGHRLNELVPVDAPGDAQNDTNDTADSGLSFSDQAPDQGKQAQNDKTTQKTTSDLLAGLVAGDKLDAMEFGPIEYIVDGLIPEGFAILAGPPKVGKSWLVGGLAVAVASGGMALGKIPVKRRPVLYLAMEDSHRRLQGRYRIISEGAPLPSGLDTWAGALRWHEALGLCREWLGLHAEERPLVIIDTLGMIKPQQSNRSEQFLGDYKVGSTLRDLASDHPGSSLIVVHHTRKGESEDFLEDLSGTQGVAGAADTVIVLRRKRSESEGTLHVTGRDINEGAYAVSTDEGRWILDGADLAAAADAAGERKASASKSSDMVSVLSAVQQIWREHHRPASPADVADVAYPHWESRDDARKRATDYLGRLFKDEQVTKPKRGQYAPAEDYRKQYPEPEAAVVVDPPQDSNPEAKVLALPIR